ncbi:Gfo/Idh/MocA family protein [Helcococcus kunzii]|uniref:Gfo/Idh/MocA family protein n=1 Tax=Helcococcus kunzii TaxID=40091 RepID=UPI0024AE2F4D|nr:Gfo/Idh/MocA family oxidoreductase [Helcococcus kunzii]
MKLGIIGAGGIVKVFLESVKEIEGIELKGICSRPGSKEKLQAICAANGIEDCYEDATEMLEKADIDTVYVATPNNTHYFYAKQALLAGKNVINEKPFASNYDEARELKEIALKNHLYIFEAVTTRYFPNTKKVKEEIKNIGKVKIANFNYSQYSSRYDAFREGKITPTFSPQFSGGALMDINIYNVNFAALMFGRPENVYYFANIENDIDTSGILILEYDGFKVVCIGAKDSKSPLSATIQGEDGCIEIRNSVNALSEYRVILNRNYPSGRVHQNDGEIYNFQGNSDVMFYELVEIKKIIESKNYERMEELLEISLITMEIVTKAREYAGIVFPSDK